MRIAEKMWEMYTLMGDTQKTNKTDKWVGGGGGAQTQGTKAEQALMEQK